MDISTLKNQISLLIKKSNTATGKEDKDLTSAVSTLVQGYGNGVGHYFKTATSIRSNSEVKNFIDIGNTVESVNNISTQTIITVE